MTYYENFIDICKTTFILFCLTYTIYRVLIAPYLELFSGDNNDDSDDEIFRYIKYDNPYNMILQSHPYTTGTTTLQDRMIALEHPKSIIKPTSTFIVRLNGYNFCKYLKKKLSVANMTDIMTNVAHSLLLKFRPNTIYVSFDELVLVFPLTKNNNHIYGGDPQKISSVVTSYASILFNTYISERSDIDKIMTFETTLAEFVYDSTYEVLNYLIWRMNVRKDKMINIYGYFDYGYLLKFNKNIVYFKTILEMTTDHFKFVMNKKFNDNYLRLEEFNNFVPNIDN